MQERNLDASLIEYLNNHESSATIMELKLNLLKNKKTLNTALQIALDDGRIDIILWLINEDITLIKHTKVKMDDEAFCKLNPLLAKILYVLNGKIEKANDPAIQVALFVRLLRRNELNLLNKILPHLQSDSSLLELALQSKQTDLATKILEQCKSNLREDPEILTAAYWAALNEPALLDKIPLPKDYALVTLQQLENKTEAFNQVAKRSGNLVTKNYFLWKHNQLTPGVSSHGEEKYSYAQKSMIQAAAAAQTGLLKQYNPNITDLTILFMHAFVKQNYVALSTILQVCKKPEELFKIFLIENQTEAASFLVIAADLDMYAIIKSLGFSEKLLKKAVDVLWSSEGLLNAFIRYSIKKEIKPKKEVVDLICLLGSEPLRKQIFTKQVNILYENEFKQMRNISVKDALLLKNEARTAKEYEARDNVEELISGLASRIQLSIGKRKDEPLPGPLLEIIVSYVKTEDHEKIKDLSHAYWERVAKVNPFAPWLTAGKVKQINTEIENIKKFLSLVDKETKELLNTDPDYYRKRTTIFAALIFLAGIATGVSFIPQMFSLIALAEKTIRDSTQFGKPCWEPSASNHCAYLCDTLPACVDRERASNNLFFIYFFSCGMGGFGLLCSLIILRQIWKNPSVRTKQTLYDKALPIETGFNNYSSELIKTARAMLSQFAGLADDPFTGRELFSITLGELVTIAENTLVLKEGQLASLTEKTGQDHVVDIHDSEALSYTGRFFPAADSKDNKQNADLAEPLLRTAPRQ